MAEGRHFIRLGNPGTVVQNLAKEAVFGTEILKSCAPMSSLAIYSAP